MMFAMGGVYIWVTKRTNSGHNYLAIELDFSWWTGMFHRLFSSLLAFAVLFARGTLIPVAMASYTPNPRGGLAS